MILHMHLVRHGQTLFNRYNKLQGWSDSPLTDSGRADADRAGQRLKDIRFELVCDMQFREQGYGYFECCDMSQAGDAAGGPHGAPTYGAIVSRFGLAATRDWLKEADPFHDAESDREYWSRVEGAFALVAANPSLADGDDVLQISHGNTLLSMAHRFGPDGLDLSARHANGSITDIDFDTSKPFAQAISITSYGR